MPVSESTGNWNWKCLASLLHKRDPRGYHYLYCLRARRHYVQQLAVYRWNEHGNERLYCNNMEWNCCDKRNRVSDRNQHRQHYVDNKQSSNCKRSFGVGVHGSSCYASHDNDQLH